MRMSGAETAGWPSLLCVPEWDLGGGRPHCEGQSNVLALRTQSSCLACKNCLGEASDEL